MAIDFPNTPTVGQQFIAAGIAWTWDGLKWVNATNIPSGYAPLNSPPFTGNPTAPTPPYGDNDTSLATTAFVQNAVAPALNNVGRNLLHNSLFDITQRGQGPFSAGTGYSADRWAIGAIGDSQNISISQINDADRAGIGDERAAASLGNTFTGNAAAGSYNQIYQRIEGIRRTAGKQITVSFWAIAAAGTPKLGVNIAQNFGTGGSPSAQVIVLPIGSVITLSTTWTRYTITITIPSIAGKSFGTNIDSSTQLEFWYSSGANFSARAGNIGVQSGTVYMWGVQLEIGSVATPLEKPDPQQDLAKCQRFYQGGTASIGAYAGASTGISYTIMLPVPMRGTPSVVLSSPTVINTAAPTVPAANNTAFQFQAVATATGASFAAANWTASADL